MHSRFYNPKTLKEGEVWGPKNIKTDEGIYITKYITRIIVKMNKNVCIPKIDL